MTPPSLRRRGCFTCPRLTIQSRLARTKIELSSLRSHSTRVRRMRSLSWAKWTNVPFWNASRMEMFSIRASRHLLSSVSRTKAPRYNICGLLSTAGAAGRSHCVWTRNGIVVFKSNRESLSQTRSLQKAATFFYRAIPFAISLLRDYRALSDRSHRETLIASKVHLVVVLAKRRVTIQILDPAILVGLRSKAESCLDFESVPQPEWSPEGR